MGGKGPSPTQIKIADININGPTAAEEEAAAEEAATAAGWQEPQDGPQDGPREPQVKPLNAPPLKA